MKSLKTVVILLSLVSASVMAKQPVTNRDTQMGDLCVFAKYKIERDANLNQVNQYTGSNRRGKVYITDDNRLRVDIKGEPEVVTGPD